MSRVGRKPIVVPSGVKIAVQNGTVAVEGPKGKLSCDIRPEITVEYDSEANIVRVSRRDDSREARALHGLTRALVANMVEGVTQGYSKTLEIYGTGYNVKLEGKELALTVGYANVVKLAIPMGVGVDIEVPQSRSDTSPAVFTVSGPDKQQVGEFAARARRVKKTEPYKGKGIRYRGEHIRRKVGKAFGAAK